MQLYGGAPQQRFNIDHESSIGEVRRAAMGLARELAFDETHVGRCALVATELATNLLRHAGGGELLLQRVGSQVEAISIDRGPGIADLSRAMSDGFSTGGSAGEGLGAVKRASSEFDLHSQPGAGTVVMSRVGALPALRFGVVCVPLRGEQGCGDSWMLAHGASGTACCVVDGLGHGVLAAESAQAMTGGFQDAPLDAPAAQMERGHRRLAGLRGAAAACARRSGAALSYCGVGNIHGHLIDATQSQGLVSHSGILGTQARRLQQFEYTASSGSLLVMHSDGLSARWSLAQHEGLYGRHPAVIAGVLYRDHGRPRDDATVLVVRQ